ncbi:MAG TPA: zinc ABC transporter substrate-binding protein [Xanthomonadales bacterium]|nr:zinc ABC transporter substrate-binding protein [Xanthomonadales bacterium]
MNRSFLFAVLMLVAAPAFAKLSVFACEPEWGALVQELAGSAVKVDVATTALQDVHQIEARPSLIAKVRRADLLVCTGAELEAGWLPQLVRQAGNAKIASGPGQFFAADHVTTLDRPATLDRAAGDIHPQGNPHVHLDPQRVLAVANALSARLAQLDAANAAAYAQRLGAFTTKWQTAMTRWQAQAAPLKGKRIIVHHVSWPYLNAWLGLEQVGALEPKPGVPPTSAHLAGLVASATNPRAYAIVAAAYQDPKAAEWLAERTGVPVVVLPYTVGGDAQAKDLYGLFDSTIAKLLAAAP